MKSLLSLGLILLSTATFAFEQTANLDFSSLYGNFDAGKYQVTVNFIPKTTLTDAKLSEGMHRDDNDLFCTTSARFEIGEMIFTIKSTKETWIKVVKKTVFGSLSNTSSDEVCDKKLDAFLGNQNLHVSLGLDSAIDLPISAPKDYDSVSVWLTPYRGYLSLAAQVTLKNNILTINPSELLTERSIVPTNQYNAGLGYYVQATKKSSALSIGLGTVDLK